MTRNDLRQWHDEWEAALAAGNVQTWAAFLVLKIDEKDAFALRLAERIAAASEVLGKVAEKRQAHARANIGT